MWVDITSNSMIVYFLFNIRVQMVVVVQSRAIKKTRKVDI